MPSVVSMSRVRARAIFAASVGAGPDVPGYGVTPWRDWLICAPSCNSGYFVVRKDAPLAHPRYFPCALKDVKALLLLGR